MKMEKSKAKVVASSPRDVYKKIKPLEVKKSPSKNIEPKRMSQVQINFQNNKKLGQEDSPVRP